MVTSLPTFSAEAARDLERDLERELALEVAREDPGLLFKPGESLLPNSIILFILLILFI